MDVDRFIATSFRASFSICLGNERFLNQPRSLGVFYRHDQVHSHDLEMHFLHIFPILSTSDISY